MRASLVDAGELTHCFEFAGLLSWTDSKQYINQLLSILKE